MKKYSKTIGEIDDEITKHNTRLCELRNEQLELREIGERAKARQLVGKYFKILYLCEDGMFSSFHADAYYKVIAFDDKDRIVFSQIIVDISNNLFNWNGRLITPYKDFDITLDQEIKRTVYDKELEEAMDCLESSIWNSE